MPAVQTFLDTFVIYYKIYTTVAVVPSCKKGMINLNITFRKVKIIHYIVIN